MGYVVQIRSEKDPKRIKEMTAHEKKIRDDWANFKRKNKKDEKIYLKKEDISKVFSKIFG